MTDPVHIGNATLYLGDKRKRKGVEHPGWLGDNVSVRGGRTRAIRMYPTIGPCIRCGNDKAERHHADDNTANNAPDNIVPLCRKCHTAEHGKTVREDVRKMGTAAAAKARREKTHCPAGHSYSGENLYVHKDGRRVCKECSRAAKRRYRARGGRG